MPAYVKGVYENLDKTWQHYEADSGELTHLETMSDGVVYQRFRLAKHEFERKYGNTLRLIGGLLVHDELNVVCDILLNTMK